MLALTALTGISLYLVATNMLLLLAGWRSLHSSEAVTLDLGTSSLTNLASSGSLPPLYKILPVKR